ncbi:hypothetical protein RB195_013363 [Necator americanus]|uniref:WD domain, G-beta repeat protein n=1 Tax=Necator americanus TaxID=51031 RepID=A0ABR1DXV8_NECAM
MVLPPKKEPERSRLPSAPSSADPPNKVKRITTLHIRRRATSGSALSRVPDAQKVGTLCKFSLLNEKCNAPVKLEAAFGRTAVGPNSLAVNERTGRIAYVAGATVVLTSFDGSRQSGEGHVVGAARHPFTCLAFSPCGRYIATGESGNQPHVRVWELRDDAGNFTGQSYRSFPYHTFSIVAVRFVPGTNLLVSVGCLHDGTICVWDWRSGAKLSTGKVTAVVNAIAISPDSSICVTVGSKHVKYWHLPAGDTQQGTGMQSRSAILADRRSSTFVDVVFVDAETVLSVTEDGVLVEFKNKKYVKIYRFEENCLPLCISVTNDAVVLGCTNGIVRLYDKQNLNVLCMLPHPAFIGMDPAVASTAELLEVHPQGVTYPDVRALCCTSTAPETFISAYSDRSMFVFRRGDNPSQWSKLSSSMAHVGAVTTVKRYPSRLPYLPTGSFITGGVDGTVRIWSMERNEDQICPIPGKNLLSPTLKKIIHVEENFGALVEPRGEQTALQLIRKTERKPRNLHRISKSQGDVNFLPNERNESTTGIRCLTVSPDGKHLVVGTKCGNIHVVDLSDPEMSQLEVISAHELDVQCLEYSNNARGAPYLLASGGRDRLVHIFRPAATSYDHCYVIDDHQSALTAVRFVQNENNDLYLFTCGSDKIIIIWRLVVFTHDVLRFNRENLISAPVGINDLLISMSGPSLMASCQDRQLRSYSFAGKLLTTVRGTGGEADLQQGFLGKFCLDPSCTYAASVCSDRHVYVVEAKTGKCVAAVTGIGESATDVEFSEDCRRLYVSASNGCIFVWRLSDTLIARMQSAKAALDTILARSESPDSLLGSGSEAVSEELPTDNTDTSSPQFGSRESLNNWRVNEAVTLHKGDEKSGSLIAEPAHVTRRTTSNLIGSTDVAPGEASDHDESKSDFISKRREPPTYTSSKSMMNLREMSTVGMHGVLTDQLDRPPRKIRSRWGDPLPNWQREEWNPSIIFQPSATTMSPTNQRFELSPQVSQAQGFVQLPRSVNRIQQSPTASLPKTPTTAVTQRSSPATPSVMTPSQSGLSQIASLARVQQQQKTFRRDSPDRVSLSKKHMENDTQPRTVWSPQAMTPKRTTSNMQSITPSGAAASAITRRQDDYTESNLHLRSRSQSPNHMMRRRDSDMSYAAASTRLTPAGSRSNLRDADTRKSTEALNKIAALRSKLHQSSENLRKSSDNLRFEAQDENAPTRTRSISNLRGGNALEAYGTFDADQNPNASSLMQSRLLARSVGNVSASGGETVETTPASRLQNTINMLKKASNPDLTQPSLYEDPGSPCGEKMRRRGAVQKKVERYHPRNRTARQQTSEESDSNGSDASPLNQSINRRVLLAGNNRSVSAMETSARIGGLTARRLFDQQRYASTATATAASPRRTPNYLAQKMAGEDMVGPDLGSDDSPRSSVNSNEWHNLMEDGSVCQQLVRHVQECFEQLQMYADKAIQARMLVDESSITTEQKRVLMTEMEKMSQKISEKLMNSARSPSSLDDANGNDYTPKKNQYF